MSKVGYPVYTTSVGWLGYKPETVNKLNLCASDEKIKRLAKEYLSKGFKDFKMKVGQNLQRNSSRGSGEITPANPPLVPKSPEYKGGGLAGAPHRILDFWLPGPV